MKFTTLAQVVAFLYAASGNAAAPAAGGTRFVMYYDEWHPDRPAAGSDAGKGITHLVTSFAYSNNTGAFTPKVPIATLKKEFPTAKIMIAIGGWGDYTEDGFPTQVKNPANFANSIAQMISKHGVDGVDIDWEYPGGNGAGYRQVPNSQKTDEINLFPKMLQQIKQTIGPNKLLSIAVPGLKDDMLAYTAENGKNIWPNVDMVNIMSYDLMNRRSKTTQHHSSLKDVSATVDNYIKIGLDAKKINLGFAYYAKYFTTASDCGSDPAKWLNCPVAQLEDGSGQDTGLSGAWTFEKGHSGAADSSSLKVSTNGTCGAALGTKCATGCCSQYGSCGTTKEFCAAGCQYGFGTGCTGADVAGSWALAQKQGKYDSTEGGQYYFDQKQKLFWTWDTVEAIKKKYTDIVQKNKLGGIMAWSLGEDSADWSHVKAMSQLAGGSTASKYLS